MPPRVAYNSLRLLVVAIIWRMNIRNALACGLIRSTFETLSPRQLQYIRASSRTTYESFIARKAKSVSHDELSVSIARDIEVLEADTGCSLLWLGNRKEATKIVYFLHGGGFFVPLAKGHLQWCWDLYITPSAAAGVKVACAILEYTLSPAARYPKHLGQAAKGLQAILDQGFSPHDIIIGGDSAGGNLTMQLLLHLHKPQPDVPPIQIDSQLAGAFLVSALLSHRPAEMPSFHQNLSCDLSPGKRRVAELQSMLVGEINDFDLVHKFWWASPIDTELQQFDGFEKVVRHIYVTYGEYEILADHSRKLQDILRARAPGLDLVVEEGSREPHDCVLLEGLTMQRHGACSRRVKAWFLRFLQEQSGPQSQKM